MTTETDVVGPVLRTRRTELRPFTPGDGAELLRLFRDPGVRRYLLDDELVDRAWVDAEIEESASRFRASGAGLWALRLPPGDEIAGFAGFRPFFEPPRLQLLYGLAPPVWGRGLATEAADAVCRHGLEVLDLGRIEAAVDVPNTRSIRVLERLGMVRLRTTEDGPMGTAFYTVGPGR